MRLEKTLQVELNEVSLQEEFLWFQKSREKWVKFGDRNSKFFHAQTLSRRRRNKVRGLFFPNGTWQTDPSLLQDEALRFFTQLFSSEVQPPASEFQYGSPPQLATDAISLLLAPVTREEVRRSVMSMKSFTAPGPDGFQPFFYKQYWPIVGEELWKLVASTFQNGASDPAILETLVVLTLKVDNPTCLKEFRPISICNVAYKVISKVLVSRLRPFLSKLIGPFQGSFLPGRGTIDNSILAQEVLNFIHQDKSKTGSLALKVDLKKAYDRIRWDFLRLTLEKFGFPSRILHLIMWSVSNATLSLIWNGNKLDPFTPSRGLRQGDPLSPYLFVLCMECLALRTHTLQEERGWRPIMVSRNCIPDSWKCKLLNKAGRLCLTRSAISVIPYYTMQTLWLPTSTCEELDRMSRFFLWLSHVGNRYWSLANWGLITLPKDRGGLGIQDARKANIALLGKLVWDLLHSPEKPWVQLFHAKYL
uniref:LINE-1 reverse transcriptase isogeny n=1 Tax=Cajanus cajan TaxID=3821 RepID=A0A151TEZ6_CAJCA|nr:LINE-1 reverse transcriptase isogeny [Cajanus cajan]